MHLHLEYGMHFGLPHLNKDTEEVKTCPKVIKGIERLTYN